MALFPQGIFGLEIILMFALFFGPLAFGCVEPWSLATLEGSLFMLAALAGRRRLPVPASALDKTVLPAILAIILIGGVQRLHPAEINLPRTFLPFTVSAYDTGQALLLWTSYAALVWSAPHILNRPGALRRLAWGVFIAGFAIAMLGLWQLTIGNRRLYGFREVGILHHPFGPYYNHDHAASLMCMSALVGLGLFFSRIRAWRNEPDSGDIFDLISTQTLVLIAVAVVVLGLVKSECRLGLYTFALGAMTGLALAFLHTGKAHGRIALVACFALLMGACFLFLRRHPHYLIFLTAPFNSVANGSLADRFILYRAGRRMLEDWPWTGFGLGAFARAFIAYETPLFNQKALLSRAFHLHNDWFELILETGPLGFAALASGLILLARSVLRARARAPGTEKSELAGWVLCACGAFALHCLFEFSFQIPANAVVFFALTAWLGAFAAPTVETRSASAPAAAGICIMGFLLFLLASAPASASWFLFEASRATLTDKPGLIARALSWDAKPEYYYKLSRALFESAYAKEGDFRPLLLEALRQSDAALRLDPANPDFRHMYGSILWHLGRRTEARRFIQWE